MNMIVFGLYVWAFAMLLFRAFVLSKLWLWFVVPSLQLPELKFVPALGICFIVFLMGNPYSDKQNRTLGDIIVTPFAACLMTFFFGWLVNVFFM